METTLLTKDGTKLSKHMCIVVLEIIHFHVSDYKKALEYFKLHLSIAKDVGDKVQQASAYGNLGCVHYHLRDLKNAMKYHQQCLNLANDAGDKRIVLVRVHHSLWFGESYAGLLPAMSQYCQRY